MKKLSIESSKRFDTEKEANDYILKVSKEYIDYCERLEQNPMFIESFNLFKKMRGYKDLKMIYETN